MITKEQVLAATGDKLSRIAGRVLKEKSYNRDPNGIGHCIPLSWEVSMKWRDWAVGEYGAKHFNYQLMQVYKGQCDKGVNCFTDYGFGLWLATKAQPSDYIKAAVLCKIGGE